jgi:polysaccharide biosynthesis protein VpsQ
MLQYKISNTHPIKNDSPKWSALLSIYLMALVTIFAMTYLRLIPSEIARIPHYDSFGHFFLIGIFSYLFHRALNRKVFKIGKVSFPLGPAIVLMVITLEEGLQWFSPYRSASFSDLFFDYAGILVFYLADLYFVRKKNLSVD